MVTIVPTTTPARLRRWQVGMLTAVLLIGSVNAAIAASAAANLREVGLAREQATRIEELRGRLDSLVDLAATAVNTRGTADRVNFQAELTKVGGLLLAASAGGADQSALVRVNSAVQDFGQEFALALAAEQRATGSGRSQLRLATEQLQAATGPAVAGMTDAAKEQARAAGLPVASWSTWLWLGVAAVIAAGSIRLARATHRVLNPWLAGGLGLALFAAWLLATITSAVLTTLVVVAIAAALFAMGTAAMVALGFRARLREYE